MQDEQASQQRPATGGISAEAARDQPAAEAARDQPAAEAARDQPAAEAAGPGSTVAARQATGETRVDETMARLDELHGLPVTEHPPVFEQVHRRLREVLGELDPGPDGGTGAPGSPGPAAAQHRPDR